MCTDTVESCDDWVLEQGPSTSTNQAAVTVSVLDRLQALMQSELSRKRKVHCRLTPHVGKRHLTLQAIKKFDPVSVQSAQIVSEFPGEQLCVSEEKAFLQSMQRSSYC